MAILQQYDDDGISQDYVQQKGLWIHMQWKDKSRQLVLEPGGPNGSINRVVVRKFKVRLLPEGTVKEIEYRSTAMGVAFKFTSSPRMDAP